MTREALKPLQSRASFTSKRVRGRRYVRVSPVVVTVASLILAPLVAGSVYFFGSKPFLVETELTLAVLSGLLFLFLAGGLYLGGRVRKKDAPQLEKIKAVGFSDAAQYVPDTTDWSSVGDVGDGVGDAEGCLGAILGVIVTVILGVALLALVTLLLWLTLNVAAIIIPVVVVGLVFVVHRVLRHVFSRSRQCQGRVLPSLGFAMFYTVAYMGWLYVVIEATAWLIRRHGA